jgi:glycerol-3-phosphate dehydrogenase (NAD(P)+)
LAEKGHDVSLWVHETDLAEKITRTRVNSVYLPGVSIPHSIMISHNMEDITKGVQYVLSVVPTQYTRTVFQKALPYLRKEMNIVSTSKGIENGTLLTVSSVLKEVSGREIAVLSGPSFAKEVVKKLPTAVTIASTNQGEGLMLQDLFNTDYFRVYTHDDVIGVEIGGALKNVIARFQRTVCPYYERPGRNNPPWCCNGSEGKDIWGTEWTGRSSFNLYRSPLKELHRWV